MQEDTRRQPRRLAVVLPSAAVPSRSDPRAGSGNSVEGALPVSLRPRKFPRKSRGAPIGIIVRIEDVTVRRLAPTPPTAPRSTRRNPGCNSQVIAQLDKPTVGLVYSLKLTVVLTEIRGDAAAGRAEGGRRGGGGAM